MPPPKNRRNRPRHLKNRLRKRAIPISANHAVAIETLAASDSSSPLFHATSRATTIPAADSAQD